MQIRDNIATVFFCSNLSNPKRYTLLNSQFLMIDLLVVFLLSFQALSEANSVLEFVCPNVSQTKGHCHEMEVLATLPCLSISLLMSWISIFFKLVFLGMLHICECIVCTDASEPSTGEESEQRANYLIAQLQTKTFGEMLKVVEFDEDQQASCCICMSDFKVEDLTTHLLCHTKHLFHHECLKKALSVKLECPYCRSSVTPDARGPENAGNEI